ncbi:unnamed protein product [Lampetra fluviatilis]
MSSSRSSARLVRSTAMTRERSPQGSLASTVAASVAASSPHAFALRAASEPWRPRCGCRGGSEKSQIIAVAHRERRATAMLPHLCQDRCDTAIESGRRRNCPRDTTCRKAPGARLGRESGKFERGGTGTHFNSSFCTRAPCRRRETQLAKITSSHPLATLIIVGLFSTAAANEPTGSDVLGALLAGAARPGISLRVSQRDLKGTECDAEQK